MEVAINKEQPQASTSGQHESQDLSALIADLDDDDDWLK